MSLIHVSETLGSHAVARLLSEATVSVKALFVDHGAGELWSVLRDHVLSYRMWLVCCLPALGLEALLPAEEHSPKRGRAFWLDFWYPVLGAIFATPFTSIFVVGVRQFYGEHLPFLNTGLLDGKPMWLQLIGAFVITDFALYLSHFVRHKIRWFWHFHAIHHSQEDLNAMTTHRVHVAEAIITTTVIFVPLAFVGGSPITWTVFVLLNGFWGYFIHANIRTNLGPLRYLVVSPQFHRVHHSKLPEHWDKNYGERLLVWDWMFGTLYRDFECYPPTGVISMPRWAVDANSGVRGFTAAWFRQFAYPFVEIGSSIAAIAALRQPERSPARPVLVRWGRHPESLLVPPWRGPSAAPVIVNNDGVVVLPPGASPVRPLDQRQIARPGVTSQGATAGASTVAVHSFATTVSKRQTGRFFAIDP